MSDKKYTPGPWRRDKYGHLLSGKETVLLRGVTMLSSGSLEIMTEAEANSDLIAAAPELLEELEDSTQQMEMAAECIENCRHDEAILHLRSLMRKKRTVIAKAKGET